MSLSSSVSTTAKLAWAQAGNLMKESVTLHTTTTTYDSNDDSSVSETNSTVNARIEVLETWQESEFAGFLRVGDAVGYFEPGQSIKVKDHVTHSSIKYEVIKILKEQINGNVIFQECWLKRIHTAT